MLKRVWRYLSEEIESKHFKLYGLGSVFNTTECCHCQKAATAIGVAVNIAVPPTTYKTHAGQACRWLLADFWYQALCFLILYLDHLLHTDSTDEEILDLGAIFQPYHWLCSPSRVKEINSKTLFQSPECLNLILIAEMINMENLFGLHKVRNRN